MIPIKIGYRELNHETACDRQVIDSLGRIWTFFRSQINSTSEYSFKNAFQWKCSECELREPVLASHFIHDELTVEDPTEQLDAHDCDLARVNQVHDS